MNDSQLIALLLEQQLVQDSALDIIWLLVNGILILMMQTGFLLLEVGSTRAKHVKGKFFSLFSFVCLFLYIYIY